jgi:putative acetyltransferase
MNDWNIRPERPGDEIAISALITAAYRDLPVSGGNEAEIVERLRAESDLTLSMIAENLDRAIIGFAAFSPITVSDGSAGWYALGPVAVIPLRRQVGIGMALIAAGLGHLREIGAAGCVVLGDPAYYGRFGFAHDPALSCPGPHPEYLQRVVFRNPPPAGDVRFARGFGL